MSYSVPCCPIPSSPNNPATIQAADLSSLSPPFSFAAKEAVIKAHPTLAPGFHRIVIERPPGGPPVAIVRARPDDAASADAQQALVSISHDGAYATAVCLGFDAARAGAHE